jgi:hypothetical protein
MNNKIYIFALVVIIMFAFVVVGRASAFKYCDGDLSYDNYTINGVEVGIVENCSILSLSCTDGYGCDPVQGTQYVLVTGVIFLFLFITFLALRRRR